MSFIHEIAEKWRPDAFVSLLKWIDGIPLSGLAGQLSNHSIAYDESSVEELLSNGLYNSVTV